MPTLDYANDCDVCGAGRRFCDCQQGRTSLFSGSYNAGIKYAKTHMCVERGASRCYAGQPAPASAIETRQENQAKTSSQRISERRRQNEPTARHHRQAEEPIDPSLVATRWDGAKYLEGYVVIEQANRIFGLGNWGYRVIEENENSVGCKATVEFWLFGSW